MTDYTAIPDDFVEASSITIRKGFTSDSQGAVVFVTTSAGLSLMDAIGMVAFTQITLPNMYESEDE